MSRSPSACDAAEADPGEETAERHPADRPGDSETEHTTDKNEEGETSLAEDTIVPVEWREDGGCWPNKYKKKATEEFQNDQPINVQLAVGFASSPMSVTASDNHDDIFHPVNRALKAAREATVNEARFHVPKQQTEDKCTSNESEIGSEKTPPTNSSSAEQEPSISPVVRRTEESCSPGDGKKSDVCSEFSDDHMSPGSEVDSEVRPTTWQTEGAPPDLDHNDEHHEQSDATLVDGDSEAPEIVTHTVESDVYSEFGDDNMFDGSEVDSEVRPTTWQTEGAPPDNDESSEQSDSTIAEHDLEAPETVIYTAEEDSVSRVSLGVIRRAATGDLPEWFDEELSEETIGVFAELYDILDKAEATVADNDIHSILERLDSSISSEDVKKAMNTLQKSTGRKKITCDEMLYYLANLTRPTDTSVRYSRRQCTFYTVMAIFAIVRRRLTNTALLRPDLHVRQEHEGIHPHVTTQRMTGLTNAQLDKVYKKFDRFAARKENAGSAYSKPLRLYKTKPLRLNPIPWVPETVLQSNNTPCGRRPHEERRSPVPPPLSFNRHDSELTPPPGGAGKEEAATQHRLRDYCERLREARKKRKADQKKEKTQAKHMCYMSVKDLLRKEQDKGSVVAKLPNIDILEDIVDILWQRTSHPLIKSLRQERPSEDQQAHAFTMKDAQARAALSPAKITWKGLSDRSTGIPLPNFVIPKNAKIRPPYDFDALAYVRRLADDSLQKYLTAVRGVFVRRAWQQWYKLHADKILSPLLTQKFKRTFRNYSPYTEECVFAQTTFFPNPHSMSYVSSRKPVADRRDLLSKPVKLPKVAPPRPFPIVRHLATPISELSSPSSLFIPEKFP